MCAFCHFVTAVARPPLLAGHRLLAGRQAMTLKTSVNILLGGHLGDSRRLLQAADRGDAKAVAEVGDRRGSIFSQVHSAGFLLPDPTRERSTLTDNSSTPSIGFLWWFSPQ